MSNNGEWHSNSVLEGEPTCVCPTKKGGSHNKWLNVAMLSASETAQGWHEVLKGRMATDIVQHLCVRKVSRCFI